MTTLQQGAFILQCRRYFKLAAKLIRQDILKIFNVFLGKLSRQQLTQFAMIQETHQT